jgi:hypothetical protein
MFKSSQEVEKCLHEYVAFSLVGHLSETLKCFCDSTTHGCSTLFQESHLGHFAFLPFLFSDYVRDINSNKYSKPNSFQLIVNGMIIWYALGQLSFLLEIDSVLKFVPRFQIDKFKKKKICFEHRTSANIRDYLLHVPHFTLTHAIAPGVVSERRYEGQFTFYYFFMFSHIIF